MKSTNPIAHFGQLLVELQAEFGRHFELDKKYYAEQPVQELGTLSEQLRQGNIHFLTQTPDELILYPFLQVAHTLFKHVSQCVGQGLHTPFIN